MRARVLALLAMSACGGGGLTIAMVEQNNSGQNGTATLADTAQGLDITISIKQAGVMRSQVSHIHLGRCDDVREIVSGLAPLSSADGGAEFEAGMVRFHQALPGRRLSEFRDGNHCINVHDPRDITLYVSCGDIK